MFAAYPSAVPVGSGHNYILLGNHHLTIRAYLAAYPGLSDKWRFYHQNGVDSTFADGEIAYRNRSGGSWTIVRARIGIGQCSSGVEMDTPDPVTGWVDVTYDGKTSREVLPGECFWSDEVTLSLPAGHDLVWEWEIAGEDIPSTPDSQAATFTDTGNGFSFREEAPLPDLFGNARQVKGRIAFLGDSITQGCQTRKNGMKCGPAGSRAPWRRTTPRGISGLASDAARIWRRTASGCGKPKQRTSRASLMG